mmetsp:Transcript_2356/g.5411  ORF Transcript_2356/g.5411 Transcript_2356/m.5411 type:complete len:145 (+) Transcript_2356:1872-2306(+)
MMKLSMRIILRQKRNEEEAAGDSKLATMSEADGNRVYSCESKSRRRVSFVGKEIQAKALHEKKEETDDKGRKSRIIVDQQCVPPKRVTLAIMQQTELLNRIQHAVLSGMVVSTDDWRELRDGAIEFGDLFKERVQFAWDVGENG